MSRATCLAMVALAVLVVGCGGGAASQESPPASPSATISEARAFAEKQMYAAWDSMTAKQKAAACAKGSAGGGQTDIVMAYSKNITWTPELTAEAKRIGAEAIGEQSFLVQSEILDTQCGVTSASPTP